MGSPFSLGTDAFPFDITAADFTCDGFIDLVTPNEGSDNVSVLINDGTGGFSTPFQFYTGAGPLSITVADFNGDGRVDIATANEDSSNVSVLLNGCVQPPTCPPDMVVPCPIVNYPTPVATCPRVTVTYEVTATDTCGVNLYYLSWDHTVLFSSCPNCSCNFYHGLSCRNDAAHLHSQGSVRKYGLLQLCCYRHFWGLQQYSARNHSCKKSVWLDSLSI